ncbi:MAG: hypothetical protein ABJF01_16465 [bacterium]
MAKPRAQYESGTGQLAGLVGEVVIQFIPPATHSLTLRHEFED